MNAIIVPVGDYLALRWLTQWPIVKPADGVAGGVLPLAKACGIGGGVPPQGIISVPFQRVPHAPGRDECEAK